MDLGFSYHVTKKNTVLIYYHGKHIYTVSEKKSKRLMVTIDTGSDEEIQYALAKITGNFKRGNEKRR